MINLEYFIVSCFDIYMTKKRNRVKITIFNRVNITNFYISNGVYNDTVNCYVQ